MAIHYFHCTDGRDVVFDRHGVDVEVDDLEWAASSYARQLMAKAPDYDGWDSWIICIHDEGGTWVETVPFPAARRPRVRLTRRVIMGEGQRALH